MLNTLLGTDINVIPLQMSHIWGRLITPTVITPTVISPTVITLTLINTPTMHPGLYHHILSNRNSKQL
jgi:hypothetical protein